MSALVLDAGAFIAIDRGDRSGAVGMAVAYFVHPLASAAPFAVLAILAWSSGDTGGDGCREAP